MLDDERLRQTIEQLATASLVDFRRQYAETLRQSIGLLSDETVRRMAELAESMQTIEQGTIAAEETTATLDDLVAA
jgi:ABC-type lipoprotein export system ATPase subunit